MTVEENKQLVRQFIEKTNNKDPHLLEDLLADNFVFHAMSAGRGLDKGAFIQSYSSSNESFPDDKTTIQDMIAEEDKVAVRLTQKTTQEGKYINLSPTGKQFEIPRFSFFRIEDGKIAEIWNLRDSLSMFQQLGALPPTIEIGK